MSALKPLNQNCPPPQTRTTCCFLCSKYCNPEYDRLRLFNKDKKSDICLKLENVLHIQVSHEFTHSTVCCRSCKGKVTTVHSKQEQLQRLFESTQVKYSQQNALKRVRDSPGLTSLKKRSAAQLKTPSKLVLQSQNISKPTYHTPCTTPSKIPILTPTKKPMKSRKMLLHDTGKENIGDSLGVKPLSQLNFGVSLLRQPSLIPKPRVMSVNLVSHPAKHSTLTLYDARTVKDNATKETQTEETFEDVSHKQLLSEKDSWVSQIVIIYQ